jgi:phosphate transport system substrate-binding protein
MLLLLNFIYKEKDMKKTITAISGLILSITALAQTSSATGTGATFPAPIYSKWAQSYHAETGNKINYTPVGSSGGITQINKRTVDFGATDDPVKPEDLSKSGQYQFPTVIGGIVAIYNLKGIASEEIVLDGKTLADIYEGKISKWNDSALVKLNPKVSLPDMDITVVARSDGSGTTAVFTDYLSIVSDSFRESTGPGKVVNWKSKNLVGGRGNAGVAATVVKIEGAIGYVEYAFAKQAKIPYTTMINKKGEVVRADDLTFAKSAAMGNWNVPGMAANLNNLDGWPITSATFILIYEKDPGNNKAVIDFWRWVFAKGDKEAIDLDYVPLPKIVKDRVLADFKKLGL